MKKLKEKEIKIREKPAKRQTDPAGKVVRALAPRREKGTQNEENPNAAAEAEEQAEQFAKQAGSEAVPAVGRSMKKASRLARDRLARGESRERKSEESVRGEDRAGERRQEIPRLQREKQESGREQPEDPEWHQPRGGAEPEAPAALNYSEKKPEAPGRPAYRTEMAEQGGDARYRRHVRVPETERYFQRNLQSGSTAQNVSGAGCPDLAGRIAPNRKSPYVPAVKAGGTDGAREKKKDAGFIRKKTAQKPIRTAAEREKLPKGMPGLRNAGSKTGSVVSGQRVIKSASGVSSRKLATDRAKKTARAMAGVGKKVGGAVARTAVALFHALAGLLGGGILLVILCLVLLIGAVAASPFGIFFSGEDSETGQTIRTATEEINADYLARLDELREAQTYDVLEMSGSRAPWREVLAVYAVKTSTDTEQGQDVVSMDEDKQRILEEVFWNMHEISSAVEIRTETAAGEEDGGQGNMAETEGTSTRICLIVTVTHRSAEEMADFYGFDADQRELLSDLLDEKNRSLWTQVLYGITEGDGDLVAVALSQVGNVGGEPYWSWYGFSSRVDWCACFVSWCANECGYIDAGVIPRFAGCIQGSNWFKNRGLWQDGGYEPRPGDIIFFDWEGDGLTDHVGIVERVENGRVYTVEGNSGDACRQNNYLVGSAVIYGFGCPDL